MKYEEITKEIIGVFYDVYNTLGPGFLEKVYENAMKIEFEKRNVLCRNQYPIKVYYKEAIVGDYIADFIIANEVIVEIKSTKGLSSIDNAQLINYLKATKKKAGLLFNFGKKPEFRRLVL